MTNRINGEFSAGYGFTVIIVALLGRLHPVGVLIAALAVSGLTIGFDAAERQHPPSTLVGVIQALIIIVIVIGDAVAVRLLPGRPLMDVVLSLATLSAGIRLALPVVLAALGALICERAGVLNLGLEGLMISGAPAGYLVTHETGSPWLGPARRSGDGRGVRPVDRARGDRPRRQPDRRRAVVHDPRRGGDELHLPALVLHRSEPAVDPAHRHAAARRAGAVVLAGVIVADAHDGGRSGDLRGGRVARGRRRRLGYDVTRTRFLATIGGSSLAALGGAVLVCGPLGLFIQNVTAGRGWVALALVVFAGWRPLPCAVGALLFGLCDAVQLRLQGTSTGIPYEVFLALPYTVTLVAPSCCAAATAARRRRSASPFDRRTA